MYAIISIIVILRSDKSSIALSLMNNNIFINATLLTPMCVENILFKPNEYFSLLYYTILITNARSFDQKELLILPRKNS